MIGALALLAVVGTTPVTIIDVPTGTPIAAIKIDRRQIFEGKEGKKLSWPYRAANSLHVDTRETFIRSLLLFKVGDPLDPALLAESARKLRGTKFLNPVLITARPVPGGAEVTVETHDQWTTELGIDFGQQGARQHKGFSLSEENLFGMGKKIILEVDDTSERTTTTLRYRDPLLFNTRWRLEVSHSNASDGSGDKLIVDYPFFSLATPRAAGLTWQREKVKGWLYVDGKRAISGTVVERGFRVWGGLRLPTDGGKTKRVTLGLFEDKTSYGKWQWKDGRPFIQPENRLMKGFEIGYEQQSDRWQVVRGFRGWHKQEDVPLGPNWSVTGAFSSPAWGGDRQRIKLGGNLLVGNLSGVVYSWAALDVSGRLESGQINNGVASVELGIAQTGIAAWRGRILYDTSRNLDVERQLALGADIGLRGWDPDTFDGTSRAVINLEWRRRLTGEVLKLGVFGFEAFADAGRTWDARVGKDSDGWRSDIGVGLLLEVTRASIVKALRLEVALPDDGRGAVVLITSTSLF